MTSTSEMNNTGVTSDPTANEDDGHDDDHGSQSAFQAAKRTGEPVRCLPPLGVGELAGEGIAARDIELKPGDVFSDRYEVLAQLAEGDRRRTYLAQDTRLERKVALSVVGSEGPRLDPEGVKREAKVLGRIALGL